MPWEVIVQTAIQEEDALSVLLEATDGERRVQKTIRATAPGPTWVEDHARRLVAHLVAQDEARSRVRVGEVVDVTPPPPPPPPRRLPLRDFLLLFTAQERMWMRARQTEPDAHGQALLDWYDLLRLSESIDLDSPTLDRALSYLVALGGLTRDRHAAILAGTPPA